MGFSIPQLASCCCGCSLRTGSLIILWIYLIFNLLFLSAPLIPTSQASNSTTPTGSITTTAAPEFQITGLTSQDVFSTICSVINVVVGIIGLYGVYKELHLYLTPFLVWEAFYTLQQVIRAIIIKFTFDVILSNLIALLILFYFWLVIFSHYRVLKGSTRPIQA